MDALKFFTSDIHFGDQETRMNLYGRNRVFNSISDFEKHIILMWNSTISKEDVVYFLGDFALSLEGLAIAERLNGKKILIKGNYDDKFDDEVLLNYFDEVYDEFYLELSSGETVYLNHYPTKCAIDYFSITGHIHGLWQVQRNMLNVSVDAWNYIPVSEDEVLFKINAIRKYYDDNVFIGDHIVNSKK